MATATLIEVVVPASKPLAGKVAFITGGSRGIGRAVALELASRGATVAINCCSNLRAAEDVRYEVEQMGVSSAIFPANISQRLEARRVVQEVLHVYDRIDILVNNAGITRDRSMRKMTDDDWCDVIDTNLSGVFYCTSAVIPAMMEQKFGRIVNVASVVGQTGAFGQANYAASKGGIIAFTKVLAIELAKYNITANVVAPGFTATDMLNGIPVERMEEMKERIPMRRFAQPEEIAKAAAFLICDGDYITGQQINVNGGTYM